MFEDVNWAFNKYKDATDGFEESFFGINEIHDLYWSNDEVIIELDKVADRLYNMDNLEEYEDVIDSFIDLNGKIDNIKYDLEMLDGTVNELFEWGNSWKELALRLIEEGNFDLNDYVEVMK